MSHIKLCYKEYPIKMTLGAMKQYTQATKRDIWCDMLKYIHVFMSTREVSAFDRMSKLYECLDFETASHAFHALIKAGGANDIPLAEIQDSMFRVGWMPTEREDGMGEPWALVMFQAAMLENEEMETFVKKKK